MASKGESMKHVLLANAASTWVMVGVIWVIQLVHYPLFARVGGATFAGYHAAHTQLITLIVLPAMLVELLTTLALLAGESPLVPRGEALVGAALVAVAWASTGLIQVPQHGQLGAGFDPEIHGALVRGNWIRTLAWTARGLLVAGWLARGLRG
jgi:hypothetical protein